jgi:hypothetical protein
MRPLAICAASLVLAVCVFATSAQDQDKAREFTSPYFPLKEGTKWVYALGKKEVTITVGAKITREVARKDEKGQDKKPEPIRCYRLHITSDDKKLTEVVGVLDDGVYRFEWGGKAISPPICFFNFKSAEWEAKGEGCSGSFTRKAEMVTVPAANGPLQSFKLSCPDFRMGEQSMSMDSWFVENFGMVKQRVKMENHDERVLELKSFQPAK